MACRQAEAKVASSIFTKPVIGRSVLLLVLLLLHGCYYVQAARGQLEILCKREPIAEVIADPDTPEAIAERLRLVIDARRYSIEVLGLPDNGSYTGYADLERDYVVWNIIAAPEFSLQPKRWCYPVVGCVAYRGYFREQAARHKALALDRAGFDVFTGGVAAYSTLGRFDDPVLNTMMSWDELRLVGVLFHELAHQLLYVRDDTAFNESFATAVEEAGVARYLADRDMAGRFAQFEEQKAFRRELMSLINAARGDLAQYYAETIDPDEKRLLKQHRIERLEADVRLALTRSGRDADGWLRAPFNNARLVSFSLYEGWLPAFRRMLEDCGGKLECFYAEARRVSRLDQEARDARLSALQPAAPAAARPAAP